jgi:hypothetical protein
VRKIRCKAKSKQKSSHPLFAVDANQKEAVVDFIQAEYSTGNVATRRDFLNFVEREFQQCLTYSWIRSFLARNVDRVCPVNISPQEKVRMEVPRPFSDDHLELIKEYVPSVPSELIFDIDECGFSDWEGRKERSVVSPAEVQGIIFHDPTNRQICRQTLICCITAAGDV